MSLWDYVNSFGSGFFGDPSGAYDAATGQGQLDAATESQRQILAYLAAMNGMNKMYGTMGADIIGMGGNQAKNDLYNGFQGQLAGILGGMPLNMPQAPGGYDPWRASITDLYKQYPDMYGNAGTTSPGAGATTPMPGSVSGDAIQLQPPGGARSPLTADGSTPALASLDPLAAAYSSAPTSDVTSPTGSRTATGGTAATTPTSSPPQFASLALSAGVPSGLATSGVHLGGTGGAAITPSAISAGSDRLSGAAPSPVGFDMNRVGATGALGAYDSTMGGQMGALTGYGSTLNSMYPALAGKLDYNTIASGFQTDPGYEWARQQGEQAINRRAAALGGRDSGATLKALSDYNQGLASQQFGNYMDRASGLASQQVGVGQNYLGALGNLTSNISNTLGNYGSNLANVATGTGANLSNLYGSYGANQSNLSSSTANNQANALNNISANSSALSPSFTNAYGSTVPYSGGSDQLIQQLMNMGMLAAMG